MFCSKCGMQAAAGSGFCGHCGATLTAGQAPMRFAYLGTGGGLMKEIFIGVVLTLATAGVFFFWAKTRFRRYYTANTQLQGERFAYVGTGLELFIGFLKALALVGLLGGALVVVEMLMGQEVGTTLAGIAVLAALLAAMPVIMTGSRRYRLSRTVFRGVRFSFRGSVGRCAAVYYSGLLLTVLTLGLYLPFFHNRMTKFFVRNTWYGNVKIEYDGAGGPLFGPHLLGVMLALVSLGFSYLWYLAAFERHAAHHTSILGTRLQTTVDGAGLFELKFLNSLLVLFTLGIGWPWARTRSLRFHIGRLSVSGQLNLDAVRQQAMVASATAEGLGTLLDGQSGLAEDLV